jgi:hypothetical protein
MTIEEKLRMYREKRQFVYELSMSFVKVPRGHSVADVNYEVFFKDCEQYGVDITEWITVTYFGGGQAHKCVYGNSNAANLEVLASMVHGGCYEQNHIYDSLTERGYKKLDLNQMTSYKEAK